MAIIYKTDIHQIVYNGSELDLQVDPESCVLIDEADTVLLDNAATLQNKHVYGLSATVVSEDSRLEHDFLKAHGFHCIDSKIDGYIDLHTATMRASISEYMAMSTNYAKLVFVNGDATETFQLQAGIDATEIDCRNLKRLQNLS